MCLESLVATMAIIAACTMEPGVYFAMNVKGEAAATAATVTAAGFPVTVGHMADLAKQVGERTLFGRTGGAATLAVGMAQIFSNAVGQRWLDLWYHFAIMFEALFILTTIDAGTRVARYILHDFLGHVWKPLGDTRNLGANLVASGLMVSGWGYFLVQGVRDPLGGINSLWPLFGIANQMLAAIALCLSVTIILKMELRRANAHHPGLSPSDGESVSKGRGKDGRPWLALVALVPMIWLVSVTFTAGVQKIWHPDSKIGFLAQAAQLAEKTPALESAFKTAEVSGEAKAIAMAAKTLNANRTLWFNNQLDAIVAGTFLVLVSVILVFSVREWILLLSGRKSAQLRETEPVWLPDYAVVEGGRNFGPSAAGAVALALALAKELSSEAALERAQQEVCAGGCAIESAEPPRTHVSGHERREAGKLYVEVTEQRFNGVRRCC
jgi:carbon starvation protein